MRRKTGRESLFVLSESCSSVRRTLDPSVPGTGSAEISVCFRGTEGREQMLEMSIALLAYKGFGSTKWVADAQLQMGHLCPYSKAQRTSWKKRQKDYKGQRKQGRGVEP